MPVWLTWTLILGGILGLVLAPVGLTYQFWACLTAPEVGMLIVSLLFAFLAGCAVGWRVGSGTEGE